jgi:hypothetical protein
MDQARILAVGLHRLIQRLVDAGIPMLFLGFPRFVEDGDYLFEQLRSILPETVTREQALAAHQRTAKREKIRAGDELGVRTAPDKTFSVVPAALNYPDHDQVDRVALGREIARLTQERAQRDAQHQEAMAELDRRAADATTQAQALAAELKAQRSQAAEATSQAAEAAKRAAEATSQAAEATRQLRELAFELAAQRSRTAEAVKQAQQRSIEVDALRRSTSWRATAWLRWLSTHLAARAGAPRLRRDRRGSGA